MGMHEKTASPHNICVWRSLVGILKEIHVSNSKGLGLQMTSLFKQLLGYFMMQKRQPLGNMICTNCMKDNCESTGKISKRNLTDNKLVPLDSQPLFAHTPPLETVE